MRRRKKKEHKLNFVQLSCSDILLQNTFPSTGKKVKEKKEDNRPLPFKEIQVSLPVVSPNKRNSENFQKAAAEEFFTNATKTWEEVYETPLGKVLPKVSSVTPRKSKNEKRKTTRSIQRKFKNAVEGVIHENSLTTFYGTRESASGYEKRRRGLYFESTTKATERVTKGKNAFQINQKYIEVNTKN